MVANAIAANIGVISVVGTEHPSHIVVVGGAMVGIPYDEPDRGAESDSLGRNA